jgi:hypothetical protein
VNCVCQAAVLRVMWAMLVLWEFHLCEDCRKGTLVHILTVQVLCKLLYLSDYIFGIFLLLIHNMKNGGRGILLCTKLNMFHIGSLLKLKILKWWGHLVFG